MAGSPTEVLKQAATHAQALRDAIGEVVVGQEAVVEQLLVCLYARSHGMLVGVPGLAKTLLVSTVAGAIGLEFGRVQFTPDLLPADITGTDILHEDEDEQARLRRRLAFVPGPIFSNLVLADEINRTPPKTQAALLQAMQEGEVTVGTTTHPLPEPFQVFATRNPIEQEGTYQLPEAQLDRFLLEIHVQYPDAKSELAIAARGAQSHRETVDAVMSREELLAAQGLVPQLPITDEALQLAVSLVRASRPEDPTHPKALKELVRFGAGPRASQALVLAAKARAVLRGEAAADVSDVKEMALPVLRHRIVLSYRAEAEGKQVQDVLRVLSG